MRSRATRGTDLYMRICMPEPTAGPAVCGGVPLAGTAGGMRGVPLAVLWIPRAAVNICEAVAGDPSRPPYILLSSL